MVSIGKTSEIALVCAYANEKDIFDRYGLNVSYVSFNDPYTTLLQFSTGKITATTPSPGLAAKTFSDGENIRIGMVLGKAINLVILVKDDISDISKLKGRTLGLLGRNSDSYYGMKWYLETKGLDIENDLELIEIRSAANLVTSFKTGQFDAVILWGAYASEVRASGRNSIDDYHDLLTEAIGHPLHHPLIMFKENLMADPDVVKRLLRAMRETCKEIMGNKEEAAEIWAEYAEVPIERMRDVMNHVELVGDLDEEMIRDLLAFFERGQEDGYYENAPGEDVFYTDWR